jgi:oligoribonuclease NrnB/cAMP/cGMP phosphodiesterase (DHH superfamily)
MKTLSMIHDIIGSIGKILFVVDGYDNDGLTCGAIAKKFAEDRGFDYKIIWLDKGKQIVKKPIAYCKTSRDDNNQTGEDLVKVINSSLCDNDVCIFADVAPLKEQYEAIKYKDRIYICDHHKLNYEPINHFYSDEVCGAGLLSHFLYGYEIELELVKYVCDRDLWKFNHAPITHYIHMALSSGEFDLDFLADQSDHWFTLDDRLIERGKEIYNEYLAKIDEYIRDNFIRTITFDVDGNMLNIAITKGVDGLYISDVLDKIQKMDSTIDIAINVNYNNETNKYNYGVRSRKGKGALIWEKFGGGGHANGQTGGFQLDYDLFS